MNHKLDIHPCPVCAGTGRRPIAELPEESRKWATSYGTYSAEDQSIDCPNCGSQYMFSRSHGKVRLNRDGQPCTHKYTGVQAGRCYWTYTCVHCGDRHSIDSGD